LKQLLSYRYALLLLVKKDLRQRTHGTVLGGGWLILQPLFLLLLYTFVFGLVMGVRFGITADPLHFALYLMAGLMPYTALQEALIRNTSVLRENRELVSNASFPAILLPLVPVLSSVITEAIGLIILILGVALIMGKVSMILPLLPVLILLRLLLTLGLAWLISTLTVFTRDLAQLLNMALLVLLFATPILYPAQMVPLGLQWIFSINPLYYLVEAYRAVLIEGDWPSVSILGLWLFALGLTWLGYAFFHRSIERAKDFL
jgi:ABC-type polysaccharide/polyol phosphate export permease